MKSSLLLVEDDMTTLNALAIMLRKKFPEVELFTATNGRKGLQSFQTNLPGIVILERGFSIDHFIQKPVIIKELFAVIAQCLKP